MWAIDKEPSFLSAARPSVHPVLWLTQISVSMQGSVPLELSGQCCFQPAFKARQAVSCFEVWLFAFVLIEQRRNSGQGEDGLTPLSEDHSWQPEAGYPGCPTHGSHTMLSDTGCSRDELCQTCGGTCGSPAQRSAPPLLVHSANIRHRGHLTTAMTSCKPICLSSPGLPVSTHKVVVCPFSDREGHKWSFTAPCVCNFMQV